MLAVKVKMSATVAVALVWLGAAPPSSFAQSVATAPAPRVPLRDTPPDRVELGHMLYNDLNISAERNTGCVTCHAHSAGFADPRSAAKPRPTRRGESDLLLQL